MFDFFVAGTWLLTLLFVCIEVYEERDWPRASFKYFAGATAAILVGLFFGYS